MSFIGILASLEKTVPMGRLRMRPFWWYLKTHWKYPQSLDIQIPCSEILKIYLMEKLKKCVDRLSSPCRGTQSATVHRCVHQGLGCIFAKPDSQWNVVGHRSNLCINILELKAAFLAIRAFQTHLVNKRFLVSYLNKQGGTHSLEMCLMIWRLMPFCNPRAILLRARHIQACLNVIADSLSHRDKIIQREWSLHSKIFQMICQIWHRPMVDMFATKLKNKLPLYVSPVPDPNAMAVDALNISWGH